MMNKAKVIRDMAAEINPALDPQIGEEVKIVAFVEAGSLIFLKSKIGSAEGQRTNKDTVLVQSAKSRCTFGDGNVVVDVEFSVVIDGLVFRGNDIYSHEELQLL